MIRRVVFIKRVMMVFQADRELWYDTHQNGMKIFKLFAFGFYHSDKFNSRVYFFTLPFLSFQFAWVTP